MAASPSQETNVNFDVDHTLSMAVTVQNLLTDYGSDLLRPSRSKDELLQKLDKLEHLLSHIMQGSHKLVEVAFHSAKDALTTNDLVSHVDMDVKASVASCMCEIIRIAAPNEPFEKDQMKVFFQLANSAYEQLSRMGGRANSKALSIIQTVSSIQSCLLMLDFEFYSLIANMFCLFLSNIRSSHPQAIFKYMEDIMTLLISNGADCDDLLVNIGIVLLRSLMKENKLASPIAFELAEKVLLNCVDELKPHLPKAFEYWGISVEHYGSSIMASIFKDATQNRNAGSKEMRVDATCHGVGQAVDGGLAKLAEDNVIVDLENNGHFTENHREPSLCRDKNKGKTMCTQLELKQQDPPILRRSIRRPNYLMKWEQGYTHRFLSKSTWKGKRKRTGHLQKNVISKKSNSSSRSVGKKSDARKNDRTREHAKTRQMSEDLMEDMVVEHLDFKSKSTSTIDKVQLGKVSNQKRGSTTSKENKQETATTVSGKKSSKLSKREMKERWRLMLLED